MLNRKLLTLILGTIAPAYLQAGTGAASASDAGAALATAVQTAADTKSNAANHEQQTLDIDWSVIPRARDQITVATGQNIIKWLSQDPRRKDAGMPGDMLHILTDCRFNPPYSDTPKEARQSIQPALIFWLQLRPSKIVPDGRNPLQRLLDPQALTIQENVDDFCEFGRKLTRLLFLNGHNLMHIKQQFIAPMYQDVMDSLRNLQSPEDINSSIGTRELQSQNNNARVFRDASNELERINREALAAYAVLTSLPLLPELRTITRYYTTDLSLDDINRVITEQNQLARERRNRMAAAQANTQAQHNTRG